MKDNNNLIPHNIWSGGEYNKNTSGLIIAPGLKITLTNEYSSIGEQSFKATTIDDQYMWVQYLLYGEYNDLQGKSTIYTPTSEIILGIVFFYSDDSQHMDYISIPSSDKPQLITLNAKSHQDKEVTSVALRITIKSLNKSSYFDNLSLTSL